MKVCKENGCGSKVKARELCNRHYLRYLHAGGEKKTVLFGPLESRWNKLYKVDEQSGCWVWQGFVSKDGNPVVSENYKRTSVNQISYEKTYGPIPPGSMVWRTCKTRGCIKPEHLSLNNPAKISPHDADYRKFLTEFFALEKRSLAIAKFRTPTNLRESREWGEAFCVGLDENSHFVIDSNDACEVLRHEWHMVMAGAKLDTPYPASGIGGKITLLTHLLLPYASGFVIDHINHDTLDNRRINLRRATFSENSCNQRKLKASSSIYKGVSWKKAEQGWRASVRKGPTILRSELFQNERDAALAYNEMAARLHGEFALLNKVEPASVTDCPWTVSNC